MQEEADGQVRAQHPQHLRHELQLVVLDPYRRALRRGARCDVGEAPVDRDVAVPPFAVVNRFDDDVVVQRPQRRIGEAFVVLLDIGSRQRYRIHPKTVLDDGFQVVGDIGLVVDDAWPADPRSAATPQQRFHRGDQAAGTTFPGDGAVRETLHIDRQPVGHDDEVGITGEDVRALSGRHLHLKLGRADAEH